MLLKMIPKRFLVSAFACALIFVTSGCSTAATQDAQVATAPAVQPAQVNPEQLQQLVAPIALYPDELVAEVLAASTYPTEDCPSEPLAATKLQPEGRNNWPPRWISNPGMRA